jgi:ubiquinone/menaquinone biosynthesis C-methylase UbiE
MRTASHPHDARSLRHPQKHFLERIEHWLNAESRWLDLGCGRRVVPKWLAGCEDIEARLLTLGRWLVGADMDFAALRDNRSCQARLLANATALPFADGSFDLVTSNMVFEHIEEPRPTLAEIRRVLQPSGVFLAVTPNKHDIVSLVAQVVPNRWHSSVVARVERERGKADVYPTFFRFNDPRTISRRLQEAGFARWQVKQLIHPNVYDHVPVVATIENAWHWLAQRMPSLCGALLIEAQA